MAKNLVVYLVGRICVVTKGANTWAVFLDARYNTHLGLREHKPLLGVPMSMVSSQTAADKALVTSGVFVNPLVNKTGVPLMDSYGVWPLSGFDIRISGVKAGTGTQQIADLSDLNAIVASVDPTGKFKFEAGILGKNPRKFGVLARLLLPPAADVTAVTEDPTPRTFQPGGHTQPIATYVRITMPFANDLKAPTLKLRAFTGPRRAMYALSGVNYAEVPLMMSNLCNCVKQPVKKGLAGSRIEDPEFGLYYELLQKPRPSQRPLPEIPSKVGGIEVPECYDACRLAL
jgi:hypothetical protein